VSLKLPFIVSLDFGSTSGKCLIFDALGRKVCQVNERWRFSHQDGENLDQPYFDDKEAWSSIASCCKKALLVSQIKPQEVACVITTSQRHGAVLLDGKGKGIYTFTNADERSAPPWQEIAKKNSEEIYKITGRWPQRVFLPSHLFWLKEHQPQIYAQIAKILGIQDWLVYRLSGVLCSEATVATDLLLYDINSRNWSPEVAEMFAIDLDILPQVIEAGTQVGVITQAAADETGLLRGTPVLNGAADSQLALLGLGALEQHDLVSVFGTSIPLLLLLDKPVFHRDGATWTNCHIFPDQWILESNSGDSGLCLTQFRNSFFPELQKTVNIDDEVNMPSLMELDALAQNLDQKKMDLLASMGPIIFDGRKWPQVEGALKGISFLENSLLSVPHLYLALVQNIVFAINGNIQQLEQTVGDHANKVFIGGPAIESSIWPQLLADILGRPVQIPEEKEATPLGSAVLAACKLGLYETIFDAVENMVALKEIEPNHAYLEFYNQRYQDWKEVYQFSLK
jgi:autoinducer 2 (AI-2) kinase